jgi:hypothetical protein
LKSKDNGEDEASSVAVGFAITSSLTTSARTLSANEIARENPFSARAAYRDIGCGGEPREVIDETNVTGRIVRSYGQMSSNDCRKFFQPP